MNNDLINAIHELKIEVAKINTKIYVATVVFLFFSTILGWFINNTYKQLDDTNSNQNTSISQMQHDIADIHSKYFLFEKKNVTKD